MIYTDGIHLVATSLEELHEFAENIGLKRHFYEGYRKGHPHYDLTNIDVRRKALLSGAEFMCTRQIVKNFQDGIFNKAYSKKKINK